MAEPFVHIRLSPSDAARLRRLARARGLSLSKVMRAALAATSDAAPPPAGSEVVGFRLPAAELVALRDAARVHGVTLSALVRARVRSYLRESPRGQAPAPAASSPQRQARRATRRQVTAPAPPQPARAQVRRRTRPGRVRLQHCGHTVPLAEAEAAGDGLVLCPKCATLRYVERS